MATPGTTTMPIVVSTSSIIHVLGYTPSEGEPGTPISARAHFHPDFAEDIYVRLLVGNNPVPTSVRVIPDISYGRWQLDALAPSLDTTITDDTKALLSVQVLNKDNAVLDTAVFGEFSYWAPGLSFQQERHQQLQLQQQQQRQSIKKPKLRIHISPNPAPSSFCRRAPSSHVSIPSPASTSRLRSNSSPSAKREAHLHRRTKLESMMRPKGIKADTSHLQTPILEIITPLQNVRQNWSSSEFVVGRRLVRFSKVQEGRRLVVSCESINQEDYKDNESVISCIYREESDTYYVTSVDIIFLLERLTNSDFPVEEKNRIRRNLEGLRPTTVSKHKHGFEDFFQRIMDFPDPKPRNIEKDLKVFEWSLLDQALEKILSKYTVDISPISNEDLEHSSSTEEASPSTGSDEADYHNIHVKTEHHPYLDSPPLPTPIQDEFPYLNSSNGSEPLCSTLDNTPSAASAYQLYDSSGMHSTVASGSVVAGHWPELKDAMSLDHYAAYEVTQNGTPVINYSDADFGAPYDAFAYHSSIEPWP